MYVDLDTAAKIAAPLITLIGGAAIRHYTEGKSKVVSYLGHVSAFKLQNDDGTEVYTHSIILRNTGRRTATNVRLGHFTLPVNVNVSPPVNYSIERNPEKGAEIIFPVLVPKEQVTVSYLYYPPLVWSQVNSHAKSDDGFVKIINVIQTPRPSKIWATVLWSFALIGCSYVLYWLIRAVTLLVV